MFWYVHKRKSIKGYDSSGCTREIIHLVWDIASLNAELFDLWYLSFCFSLLLDNINCLILPFRKEVENGHPTSSFRAFLWPSRGQLLRVMYQAWKGSRISKAVCVKPFLHIQGKYCATSKKKIKSLSLAAVCEQLTKIKDIPSWCVPHRIKCK